MARITNNKTPTEQDIMGYSNVPLEVAARYIGWSSCTLRKALIQERAPFGCAVQTGSHGKDELPSYAYNISPGLLIKYKSGELNAWKLNQVIKLAADGIQDILDQRLAAAAELVAGLGGGGRRLRDG